jgi:hypothetical protein
MNRSSSSHFAHHWVAAIEDAIVASKQEAGPHPFTGLAPVATSEIPGRAQNCDPAAAVRRHRQIGRQWTW